MKAIAFIFCGMLFFSISAFAQTWVQTGANTNYVWDSIVSSADGTKLAAATFSTNPGIYTSTNSGALWTWDSNAPSGEVFMAASSADGTKLLALVDSVGNENNGYLYISTNAGGAWTQEPQDFTKIAAVACSADGNIIMVASLFGIYISTNTGNTFLLATNLTTTTPGFATCSASGEEMADRSNNGRSPMLVSTNCGMTWFPEASPSDLDTSSLLSTPDGSKLMAAFDSSSPPLWGELYISTNWGATWSFTNASPVGQIVCSANGSLLLGLVPADYPDPAVYTSTNSGVTWTSNSLPVDAWNGVACSADGNELLAAAGDTHLAGTNGVWILQTPPSPQLNISSSNSNLNFSWIVPSTNMVLQESPDLSTWTTLTNAPSLNYSNLEEQLTLSPTNNIGFFRLVSQ